MSFRFCAVAAFFFVGTATAQAKTHARPAKVKDECAAIRKGLDWLPANGGTYIIPPGKYVCGSPIVVDRDHTTLDGGGKVTLELADSANAPVIVMGHADPQPAPSHDIEVRGLKIDGNRAHQQYECWGGPCGPGGHRGIRNNGISVRGVVDSRISNIDVTSARSGGIVTEDGCLNLTVDRITVTDSFFDGFAGYETHGSTFRNMKLYKNNAAGISLDLHFDGNTIENAQLLDNHDVGVFMRDSGQNVFAGLDVEDSGNFGLFLSQSGSAVDTCPNDNEFRDLTVLRSAHEGFRLNSPCVNDRLTGTAHMAQNQGGCMSEADGAKVTVAGQLDCQN